MGTNTVSLRFQSLQRCYNAKIKFSVSVTVRTEIYLHNKSYQNGIPTPRLTSCCSNIAGNSQNSTQKQYLCSILTPKNQQPLLHHVSFSSMQGWRKNNSSQNFVLPATPGTVRFGIQLKMWDYKTFLLSSRKALVLLVQTRTIHGCYRLELTLLSAVIFFLYVVFYKFCQNSQTFQN